MSPKRLSIKFYAKNPAVVDSHAFVAVFQRWIQEHSIDGLLIDVADYKHVPNGPGILLIAHEGDYSWNEGEGRGGVQYISKHPIGESLESAIAQVLRLTLEAALQVEKESALNGLALDFSSIRLVLQDRLQYPNNKESFTAVKPQLAKFFEEVLGVKAELSNANASDGREALTFAVKLPEGITGAALLDKLKVAE
jgi:hypothetical protein